MEYFHSRNIVLQGHFRNTTTELLPLSFISTSSDDNNEDNEDNKQILELYATRDSTIAVVSKNELSQSLLFKIEDCSALNTLYKSLKKLLLFKFLENDIMMEILAQANLKEFTAGSKVELEDKNHRALFIIKSGIAEIDGESFSENLLKEGSCIGEYLFLEDVIDQPSVIAKKHVECWWLTRETIIKTIPPKILEWIKKKYSYKNININLSQLKILKKLESELSKLIFLVEDGAGMKFVVKTINRNKLSHAHQKKSTIIERKCNLIVNSPMIVDCINCISDKYRIYSFYEYVESRSLRTLLKSTYTLSENEIKYYFASMILILESIHKHNIVYRTLSTSKFLITPQGYLKLKDFNNVKITKRRTYTVTGEVYYMAPEMILGKGYCFSIDLWGLGIILYEMVFSERPFITKENNSYSVFGDILQGNFAIPNLETAKGAVSIIKQLLSVNPLNRGTLDSLKHEEWLCDIDWKGISNLTCVQEIECDLEADQYQIEENYLLNVIDALETLA